MSFTVNITLNVVGGNINLVELYSNPISASNDGVLCFSGITGTSLQSPGITYAFPDGTTTVRVKAQDGVCAGTSYYDMAIANIPSPTPTTTITPTVTQTMTPTPTTVKYWLKMLRCDEDPTLLNYHYSLHSYLNNSIQRGELFRGGSNGQPGSAPAGFYYYTVVDLLLTDPSGTVEGSKSVAPYATNCGEDPTHFVGPTYRTAHMTIASVSSFNSYTDYKNKLCNKYIYDAYSYSGNTVRGVFFDASVTGTTPTPGVAYNALYNDYYDGSAAWTATGQHYWVAALGGSNQFTHIVYIDNGQIGEWRDCTTGLPI